MTRHRQSRIFDGWETVEVVKPINNINSIALMLACTVGLLVFCVIVGSLVVW